MTRVSFWLLSPGFWLVVIDVETEGEEATHELKRGLDEVPGTLRT
jgi:hypothetical protein